MSSCRSPHRSQEPAQIVACLLPRCCGLVMRSSALIPRHNLHIYNKFDFSLNFDRVLDRAGGGQTPGSLVSSQHALECEEKQSSWPFVTKLCSTVVHSLFSKRLIVENMECCFRVQNSDPYQFHFLPPCVTCRPHCRPRHGCRLQTTVCSMQLLADCSTAGRPVL